MTLRYLDRQQMKKIITLLFCFVALTVHAQKPTLVPGIYRAEWPKINYFRIVPGKIPCKDIIVRTNNGYIEQSGCFIVYQPDTLKPTVFKILRKQGKAVSLIDSVRIHVESNQHIFAAIGVKQGGLISSKELMKMGGLIVKQFITDDHTNPCSITSYRITIFHGDSVLSCTNAGPRYNDATKEMLSKLKTGDKILFSEIRILGPNSSSPYVRPAEFTIGE